MDGTCLNGALGHIFKPATRDGEPADAWVVLRTKWVMDLPHKVAQAARDRRSAPIPTLVKDQVLHLDPPYYPEEARRAGKEGACGLHVRVSANGDVEEITLTRSAGSPDLDTACRAAIHAAEFVPAQLDGKPTAGATDIWLVWRLPK